MSKGLTGVCQVPQEPGRNFFMEKFLGMNTGDRYSIKSSYPVSQNIAKLATLSDLSR